MVSAVSSSLETLKTSTFGTIPAFRFNWEKLYGILQCYFKIVCCLFALIEFLWAVTFQNDSNPGKISFRITSHICFNAERERTNTGEKVLVIGFPLSHHPRPSRRPGWFMNGTSPHWGEGERERERERDHQTSRRLTETRNQFPSRLTTSLRPQLWENTSSPPVNSLVVDRSKKGRTEEE